MDHGRSVATLTLVMALVFAAAAVALCVRLLPSQVHQALANLPVLAIATSEGSR